MTTDNKLDEIKVLLNYLDEAQLRHLQAHLRQRLPPHPFERELMTTPEGLLEAFARAGDFTVRMIRGVLAEAAFAADVLPTLAPRWRQLPIAGDRAYDFLLTDVAEGSEKGSAHENIRIQVKLQRSAGKKPLFANNHWKTLVKWPSTHYIVEIQKSRKGEKKGESTRPYRFNEFDVLAVSLGPSRGRWSAFIYTVERWLLPDPTIPTNILTFQPVAPSDCDCWTTDFNTVASWLRSGVQRHITGDLPRPKPLSRKLTPRE
jgi:hypothetical protein